MATTRRVTVVRRASDRREAPARPVENPDPEYAITVAVERLAAGLAMVAESVSPAPLPDLPPRRVRVRAPRATPFERGARAVLPGDRLASRSA